MRNSEKLLTTNTKADIINQHKDEIEECKDDVALLHALKRFAKNDDRAMKIVLYNGREEISYWIHNNKNMENLIDSEIGDIHIEVTELRGKIEKIENTKL